MNLVQLAAILLQDRPVWIGAFGTLGTVTLTRIPPHRRHRRRPHDDRLPPPPHPQKVSVGLGPGTFGD
jgi:hypothetical protein